MYNSIILSACFLGSAYIFSTSLELINWSLLENKKIPRKLMIINELTFIVSGTVFISSFLLLNTSKFKL
jgi:hypothetical protein